MIQRAIATLSGSAVRHRAAWLAVALGVLVVASILGSRLELRLDARDLWPVSEATGHQDSLVEGRGRIGVVLESAEPMDVGAAGAILETLAGQLAQVDGIRAVRYRVPETVQRFAAEQGRSRLLSFIPAEQLRRLGATLSRDGIERALTGRAALEGDQPANLTPLPRDPLGVLGLATVTADRWRGGARVRVRDGYLSSLDGRAFLAVVEPETGLEDVDEARALVNAVRRVAADVGNDSTLSESLTGVRVTVVGRPVSYVEAFDTLYDDLRRVGTAAVVLVLLAVTAAFRTPVAALALALPLVLGVAVAGAVAFVAFGSVSLFAWVFVLLLVGLGVDFGIHVATHYWLGDTAQAPHDPPAEPSQGSLSGDGPAGAAPFTRSLAPHPRAGAALSATTRPGRGIFFGALTSVCAFASLSLISYPVMSQIALMAASGLVAIMAGTFVLVPLVLAASDSDFPALRWPSALGAGVATLVTRRRPWVVAGFGALAAACLLGLPSVRFEPHPWSVALRGNPATAELQRVANVFGSALTPIVLTSEAPTAVEALAMDRAANAALLPVRIRAGVASVESLSNWFPSVEHQLDNARIVAADASAFSPERFLVDYVSVAADTGVDDPYLLTEYPALVETYLAGAVEPLTLEDVREMDQGSELDRYLMPTDGGFAAVTYVYLREPPWAAGASERFLAAFDDVRTQALDGVRITGEGLRSTSHAEVLMRDLLRAGLAATALVVGLLWWQFRGVRSICVCMLPVVMGLAAALLAMAVTGIELNVLTLAVLPLLVGLGVDDGVHMVERLDRGDSVRRAATETGSGVVLSTATTVVAFMSLMLAEFEGLMDLALVGSVGLAASMMAALWLVPAVHGGRGRRSPN